MCRPVYIALEISIMMISTERKEKKIYYNVGVATKFFIVFSRKFYYPADAYNKSKLAQVMFSKHLETIFREENLNIQSHSLHPGVVNTDLFQNSSTTYIPWIREIFFKVIDGIFEALLHLFGKFDQLPDF